MLQVFFQGFPVWPNLQNHKDWTCLPSVNEMERVITQAVNYIAKGKRCVYGLPLLIWFFKTFCVLMLLWKVKWYEQCFLAKIFCPRLTSYISVVLQWRMKAKVLIILLLGLSWAGEFFYTSSVSPVLTGNCSVIYLITFLRLFTLRMSCQFWSWALFAQNLSYLFTKS